MWTPVEHTDDIFNDVATSDIVARSRHCLRDLLSLRAVSGYEDIKICFFCNKSFPNGEQEARAPAGTALPRAGPYLRLNVFPCRHNVHVMRSRFGHTWGRAPDDTNERGWSAMEGQPRERGGDMAKHPHAYDGNPIRGGPGRDAVRELGRCRRRDHHRSGGGVHGSAPDRWDINTAPYSTS